MKIIKIIFSSLLALILVLATGIFILFQTLDTDQYLPQITKKASQFLGRPVSIGHLGLGLSLRGITLDAAPVIVADDQDFTQQPFIKIDRVRISFDLRMLVLEHKIHIIGILLQSPQVHFIRSQQGDINVHSIASLNSASKNTAVIATPSIVNDASSVDLNSKDQTIPGTKPKELGLLMIQDGSISFIDQSSSVPLDIWLSNINASVNDLSLSKPFSIVLSASLYRDLPNVQASALVSLDLSKRSVQVSDLKLNIDLSQLDVDRLKGVSPQMQDNPILKNITGAVQLDIAALKFDPSGGLEANGAISITGVVIKDFNVVKMLLSHALGSFGGINIDNIFNGSLKDQLGASDTVINKAEAQISFHDKTVFIDDSSIQTNIFEFTAKGSVDHDLNLDMQTVLHLNNDISVGLIKELEGLRILCDDSKRITIDAGLSGVIPHLKYKPSKSFRKKSKRALIEEGGNILSILFNK